MSSIQKVKNHGFWSYSWWDTWPQSCASGRLHLDKESSQTKSCARVMPCCINMFMVVFLTPPSFVSRIYKHEKCSIPSPLSIDTKFVLFGNLDVKLQGRKIEHMRTWYETDIGLRFACGSSHKASRSHAFLHKFRTLFQNDYNCKIPLPRVIFMEMQHQFEWYTVAQDIATWSIQWALIHRKFRLKLLSCGSDVSQIFQTKWWWECLY